jgi:hypothetical protein
MAMAGREVEERPGEEDEGRRRAVKAGRRRIKG